MISDKITADNLFSLKGNVAIITGGYKGMGLSIAEALAAAGADIILCSRKIDQCEQQAEIFRKRGIKCAAIKCDVTNPDDIKSLAQFALSEFGGVHILVNNAGATWGASVVDYPLEGWNKVLSVNVTGVFLCSQAIGKIMINQKKGKIINVASIMGVYGGDPSYMDAIAYNTSKGSVIAFTKDLAVKWASYKINVNVIAPGFMVTDMSRETIEKNRNKIIRRIPFGRLCNGNDLKGSVIFLASSASDYMTGQVLFIDGGWHCM